MDREETRDQSDERQRSQGPRERFPRSSTRSEQPMPRRPTRTNPDQYMAFFTRARNLLRVIVDLQEDVAGMATDMGDRVLRLNAEASRAFIEEIDDIFISIETGDGRYLEQDDADMLKSLVLSALGLNESSAQRYLNDRSTSATRMQSRIVDLVQNLNSLKNTISEL